MFSNKEVIPVQDYRIDIYPSLKELVAYTEKAQQVRGMKHVYIWEDKELHKLFKLGMLARQGIPEMEWWLHEESVVGNRMVFFYKTKDMHLIFAQMCEAVGAPASLHEEEIEAHREYKKNYEKEKDNKGSLGDRLVKKKPREITAGAFEGDSSGFGTGESAIPAGAMGGFGSSAGTGEIDLSASVSDAGPRGPEDFAANTMSRLMGGDLKVRPIGAIINTAAQSDVTGHLRVSSPTETVVVQFGLGRPVHAYSDTGKEGLDVLLELFACRQGQATFEEGLQPEAATIQESCQEIIQQGEALLANYSFLEMNNINEISVLQKPPMQLNEDKMLERLQDGALLGIKVQQYFIENIDGFQTIAQIAGKANLPKSRWVGIVGNLLKLGLVHTPEGQSLNSISKKQRDNPMQLPGKDAAKAFQEAVAQTGGQSASSDSGGVAEGFGGGASKKSISAPLPPSFLFNKGAAAPTEPTAWPAATGGEGDGGQVAFGAESPQSTNLSEHSNIQSSLQSSPYLGVPEIEVPIEQSQADAGRALLLNSHTGIFSFEGFQFLLNNEFARAFRFGTDFTLVVFCVKVTGDGAESVGPDTVIRISGAVKEIIREVDHLGHFGERAFGLLLPGVNSDQAVSLCQRINGDLPTKMPELANLAPSLHFGLATVPSDAQQLPLLVSVTQQAMFKAVESGSLFVQASRPG
ncbi:MAG: DUF4388 domain-containing protein [Cyanobacteriota/Melainabacteria group bacterium]|nr:DUF4388 domain-containing protein [Candidatus Obscuribacterales bacterium]